MNNSINNNNSSILSDLKDYKVINGQGYVYIFEQKDSGLIKIGRTSDVEKRLRTLQNQSGNKIVNYYISEPMYLDKYVERILHNKFARYRYQGEYFKGVVFNDIVIELEKICESNDFKLRNISDVN